MDILAHTLWAGAGAKGANAILEKKNKNFHISVGWTAFWGIFPDLFAFTIPFTLRFYYTIVEQGPILNFFGRTRGGLGGAEDSFDIARILYQYSHSLVIWALVFFVIWMIFKRPRLELFGWLLHILIDIPTHVLAFYPTPFLFPISDYRFPYGTQWSGQWFMIINYSGLLLVWGFVLVKNFFTNKKPS